MEHHSTLHIFNPETDYALALGRKRYCPPSAIVKMRRNMALFPSEFAEDGDIIATVDDIAEEELRNSVYYPTVTEKRIRVVSLRNVAETIGNQEDVKIEIRPWGWNHTIRRILAESGVDEKLLKTEAEIDKIRELSHRGTVIGFQQHLQRSLPGIDVAVAKIFSDKKEAFDYCMAQDSVYLKMPWSCSGRGVVCTRNLTEEKIKEWITGSIKRQGSVMAEEDRGRTSDFATEWMCRNGSAEFRGYSLFETTEDGRYKGNIRTGQDEILRAITGACGELDERVVCAQKKAIEELIAPGYDGPVGIDMLATGSGKLNPCVEINLRQTMGMVGLR